MIDYEHFWKPSDPNLTWKFFAVLAIVGLTLYLVNRIITRYHEGQERRAFFEKVAERNIAAEYEDLLVDLVNQHQASLHAPLDVFRSLKVFDRVASLEIERVLALSEPTESKRMRIDGIYALRAQMFPQSALASLQLKETA